MTTTTWTQTAGMDSGSDSDTVLSYAEAAALEAAAAAASAVDSAASAGTSAASAAQSGVSASQSGTYANNAAASAAAAAVSAANPNVVTVAANISNVNLVGGSISNVNSVSAGLTNINTVAGNTSNVTTVAGISADVTTVSGIAGNVSTVAGMNANITSVLADATDIGLVAGSIAGVNSVAGSLPAIIAVNALSADITAVNADAADIGTVAGIAANVTAVAGARDDILEITAGNNLVNVGAVAGLSAQIPIVAGDSDEINALAAITSNVQTVAGISANVTTVAGSSADVSTVAGSIGNVNSVAAEIGSLVNIQDSVTAASASAAAASVDADDAQAAAVETLGYRDTANLHKLAAEAAATSATNTASALVGFDLEAIAANKAVTAVDVFVYDTSKDSDGGAWRKRTQGTSWYNETLNTATRGSRKDFPAVAVIVAEAAKVTIYDGDDPALPMWMVFNQTSAPSLSLDFFRLGRNASCVYAINGQMCFGTKDNAVSGLCVVPFIRDDLAKYTDAPSECLSGKSIANRNLSVNMVGNSYPEIVQETVNDVAMTVLPDAPIDAATGLPIPTIAVATNGGVSVIKDDGNVWDITHSSFNVVSKVSFNSYGGISYFTDSSATARYHHVDYALPDADVVKGLGYSGANSSELYHTATTSTYTGETGKYSVFNGVGGLVDTGDELIVGGASGASGGVAKVSRSPSAPSTKLIAEIKSSYNTGWMNGDIKGAFLSDTDTALLVGSGELVTNGTFDTDVSGWTLGGGYQQWVDGTIELADVGGVDGLATQNLNLPVGSTYTVSFDVEVIDPGAFWLVKVLDGVNGSFGGLVGSGSYSFIAKSTFSNNRITLLSAYAQKVRFDNISVQLADEDRSVNNKGLIINGTITRAPVATGAELVAYSGFSATGVESTSNFLKQPYNSGLDFGAGEFAIMWWENKSVAATRYQMDRRGSTNTGKWTVYSDSSNKLAFFAYDQLGTLISGTKVATNASTINTWVMNAIVRDASGTLHFYLNGNRNGSHAFSGNITDTNADAVLDVGNRNDHANAWDGSLALLRISATAPTAEQIAKIYNDEKYLFQENAACTLYGTSDAVTALAHDDSTQMLHVGTSAGRSVFDGLRRVSNTTTAVGTAISASNNLIAEE